MTTPAWATAAEFREFLDSLGNEVAGLRYDLSTAAEVIPRLHPRRLAPAVLVAGTNGKGSVSWWLSRVLAAAGCRVGLYTSPHLLDLRERIRVDDRAIPEEDLLRHANRVRGVIGDVAGLLPRQPTYYEWVTFVAASYFQEQAPDVNVLEIGLGGRLDAVNVAEPVLSVITTVGLDHCRLLGGTVEAIAREKMGILRPGIPAVLGPQDDWTAGIEEELAGRCGEVIRAREIFDREFGGGTGTGSWILGLAGRFQRCNAATVVACGRMLRRMGWPVGEEALERGLRESAWAGRMQRLSSEPEIVIDGAHNPPAVASVVEELRSRPLPPVVVFGAMRDKDYGAMLRLLQPAAAAIVLTRVPLARAAGREEFDPFVDGRRIRFVEDPEAALAEAIRLADGRTPVFVLGSLYLAAAVLQIWSKRGVSCP
jgi:dihydrofolate synthase/folylpolyglutamate synthase